VRRNCWELSLRSTCFEAPPPSKIKHALLILFARIQPVRELFVSPAQAVAESERSICCVCGCKPQMLCSGRVPLHVRPGSTRSKPRLSQHETHCATVIYIRFSGHSAQQSHPKPPSSHLQAICLGGDCDPQATHKPPQSHPHATLMRPSCDPHATLMRPSCDPQATPNLNRSGPACRCQPGIQSGTASGTNLPDEPILLILRWRSGRYRHTMRPCYRLSV
jgi:hypothetical protein